jgi:hypothetical protein
VRAGEFPAGGFGGGEAVGVHGAEAEVGDGDLMAVETEDADVFGIDADMLGDGVAGVAEG